MEASDGLRIHHVDLAVGDVERSLVGLEHLAFYVDTRAEVDAAYRRCCEIGARVHFPPEEDKDIEGYYEMFVFDPDGHRIEIACCPADRAG